jgi:hypothetical protein
MPTGEIEPRQVAVLKEVGAWLEKYGESIYGTRGGPFRNGAWGGSTRKDSAVYLHIMKWQDRKVTLPGLDARIVKSTTLTGGEANVSQAADKIIVTMPADLPAKGHTIVKLELDRPVAGTAEESTSRTVSGNKALGASVRLTYEPNGKYRGNGGTSLADGVLGSTNPADGGWLGFEGDDCEAVVDLGKTQLIREIALDYLVNPGMWVFEPLEVRFEISRDGRSYTTVAVARNDAAWDSLIRTGMEVGTFQPTEVRYVRIAAKNRKTCPPGHPGNGGKAWLFVDEIMIQ